MQKMRILFAGVYHFPHFLDALEYLDQIGNLSQYEFKYRNDENDWFEIETSYHGRDIERHLNVIMPKNVIIGIEYVEEEEKDVCHA